MEEHGLKSLLKQEHSVVFYRKGDLSTVIILLEPLNPGEVEVSFEQNLCKQSIAQ